MQSSDRGSRVRIDPGKPSTSASEPRGGTKSTSRQRRGDRNAPQRQGESESSAPGEELATRPLRVGDCLPLGLAVISLILGVLLFPAKRGYWLDEHYTDFVLKQASLADALTLTGDMLSASPPTYFVLAWGWKSLFGLSCVSMRMFSCLAFSGAMVSIWMFLRSAYTPIAASIGVVTTFLLCQGIQFHSRETRYYGLFLLEVTLLLILHCRTNARRVPSLLELGGLTLLHALLVTTHYFGIPYSGALLFSALAYRLSHRLPAAKICGAVVLGWMAFLPCLPALARHTAFSKPHGWIPIPPQHELFRAFEGQISGLALILMVLAFLIGFLFLTGDRRNPNEPTAIGPRAAGIRLSLLIGGACLLLVPVATWTYSQFATPIYMDRYLLATVLTWAILITHLVDFIWSRLDLPASDVLPNRLPAWVTRFAPRAVLLAGLLVALPQPIRSAVSLPNVRRSAACDAVAAAVTGPIVLEDIHQFLDCMAYAPNAQRYYMVLDWDVAISPQTGRDEVNNTQIMETCRRWGCLNNILTTEEFFQRFPRFTVIRAPDRAWSKIRVWNNPVFDVKQTQINGFQVLHASKAVSTASPK